MSNSFLHRYLPFLNWIGELKDQHILRADIIAGITLSLVLIPQAMANAQLAEMPPYYGFYASFVPIIVSALFGSSRQLSTGPVALVALMVASELGQFAVDQQAYIAYAILLALMVGLLQFGLGVLRLGVLVNFLSHPVIPRLYQCRGHHHRHIANRQIIRRHRRTRRRTLRTHDPHVGCDLNETFTPPP